MYPVVLVFAGCQLETWPMVLIGRKGSRGVQEPVSLPEYACLLWLSALVFSGAMCVNATREA